MRRRTRLKKEVGASEAALLLGVSRERLVRLIQRGQLKGRRDSQQGWLVGSVSLMAFRRRLRLTEAARRGGHHG